MKKLSIFLLALVAGAGTMFASDTQVDGIWYDFDDEHLTAKVTYQGDKYSGEVVIPSSVTYNGKTYTVTSIGYEAFQDCSGLTSVTIPNTVTSIGTYAFDRCTSLDSVTIPNSVTSIGEGAFRECTGLTSVTIPNSVTSMGKWAFQWCDGLPVVDNLRYADTYLVKAVDTTLSSYTIKDGTKWIGESAFECCSSLTSVTIPNTLTSIGNDAFNRCTSLDSVTIPNSVTSIGEAAFWECRGLTSVTMIGNSVTSIGKDAFYFCTGLDSVTIPSSVTSIGEYAFYACHLRSLTNYATTPQSINSNVFGGDDYLNPGVDKSYCVLNVPKESVSQYLAAEVWKGFANIVGVDVPKDNCVGGIWYNFNGENLTAEVTYRGDASLDFQDRYSGEVVIPSSVLYNAKTYTVTAIGREAFANCRGLTSVTIPGSVTSIGVAAFDGCTGLDSVTIPNTVTSIGESAFSWCSGLTSVSIPNSVTSIGYNTFADCTGLTSVEIPNSVTSIGISAFNRCTGLTSVTIPSSVASIGAGAFQCCSKLTSITNYATTPQSINSNVFGGDDEDPGVDRYTCVLYVPNESVRQYQAADGWKEFRIVGVDVPDVPSSAPAVYTNPANPAQKLIKNGNVYILTEDKTYTITGAKVKSSK